MPPSKAILEAIDKLLVEQLAIISREDMSTALEESRSGGAQLGPWEVLQSRGKLTPAQCRALAMAEKGYLGLNALHGALASKATASTPLPPQSAAPAKPRPSNRVPTTEMDDDSVRSVLRTARIPPAPPTAPGGASTTREAALPPPIRASSAGSLIGKTLGRFQIISQLGRGASGSVYLAQHLTLGIPVAVKVLSSQLALLDQRHVDRFQHEARAAMRLSHPAIVRVHDLDFVEGLYLIVMEYVDGMTVAEHIKMSGPMSESLALIVAKGVAEALEAAHAESIIHRDVKPANIMITKARRVKLADLGLAKALGTSSDRPSDTGVNAVLGTPYYFSPEQAKDAASVDHRADIYSLGCTFYHMLAGRVPYEGRGLTDVIRQHEHAPIPDVRALRPEISRATSDLVQWMMAKDPAQRPQDYAAVISAIQRCIVGPQTDDLHAAAPGAPRNANFIRRIITNVLGDEKPTSA